MTATVGSEPISGSAQETVPESVLRRLRNLLKLAADPAAPNQAASAAAIAAKLMRKYDLTVAAVETMREVGAAQRQPNGVIARIIYICGRNVPTWVKPIISAVTVAQHCHTIVMKVDDDAGKFHHTEFMCFGTEHDTDVVCQIVQLITEQIDRLAKLYINGNRNSYRVGAAVAVRDRIEAAVVEAEDEVADSLRTQLPAGQGEVVMERALAVLDTRRVRAIKAAEEAELDERKPRSVRLDNIRPDGFADGYRAGKRVKIQLAAELPGAGEDLG